MTKKIPCPESELEEMEWNPIPIPIVDEFRHTFLQIPLNQHKLDLYTTNSTLLAFYFAYYQGKARQGKEGYCLCLDSF
jgi:hypothetical protein